MPGVAGQKALVIGAGFGGLAAALRLRALGYETEILELQDKPGGRAYVFEQDGFTFDAGPTVITAPWCIDELFSLHGRRREDYVELLPIEPMYRLFWEDGTTLDYHRDEDQLKEGLRALSNRDAEAYDKFFRYTREVYEEGYVKLGTHAFLRAADMLRAAPKLLRVGAQRSVYSAVSRYFKHPKIRQAFSFNSLLVGGNPFRVSSIYTLIHPLEREWGAYYARGGTGALVAALARLFEEVGGRIRYRCNVDRIVTEAGRVRGVVTGDGERVDGDVVVSNADVVRTYTHMLRHEPRVRRYARRLAKKSYSMSLFVLHFGTNRNWPELSHHNVMFGPRYREHLRDIFDRGHLADDFSLYLHAPTKSDPSTAPDGHHSFYVLSPVPHLGRSSIDWEKTGPAYAEHILDYLEKRYMPGLKDSLKTTRIFTPDDFKNRLQAHQGSAFSLAPLLTQSAYFRTHNRDPRLRGFYIVGAGTHPGAGIPGVIGSADATVSVIAKDAPKTAQDFGARSLRHGSLSFHFASRLLGRGVKEGVRYLYAWCRHVDDAIDGLPAGTTCEEKRAVIDELEQRTVAAHAGEPAGHPAFSGVTRLAQGFHVPREYFVDLLAGMRMDVEGLRYETLDELSLYCHRVAGVVGLMFCHVAGVSDASALRHAADLGAAMQLSNIARDVRTDGNMGRVYLPTAWLREAGVDPDALLGLDKTVPPALAGVVHRLLEHAETLYRSGEQGLRYLPPQASLAVAVALNVYREIGREVDRRGPRAWEERVVIPLRRKLVLAARALSRQAGALPARLATPFSAAALPPMRYEDLRRLE